MFQRRLRNPAAAVRTAKAGGRPGSRDAVAADQLDRALTDPAQAEQRPARDRALAVRLEREVRRDADARREPGAEPVLRHVGDPGRDRRARITGAEPLPGDADGAAS